MKNPNKNKESIKLTHHISKIHYCYMALIYIISVELYVDGSMIIAVIPLSSAIFLVMFTNSFGYLDMYKLEPGKIYQKLF